MLCVCYVKALATKTTGVIEVGWGSRGLEACGPLIAAANGRDYVPVTLNLKQGIDACTVHCICKTLHGLLYVILVQIVRDQLPLPFVHSHTDPRPRNRAGCASSCLLRTGRRCINTTLTSAAQLPKVDGSTLELLYTSTRAGQRHSQARAFL